MGQPRVVTPAETGDQPATDRAGIPRSAGAEHFDDPSSVDPVWHAGM
jgi:hypothetical protein